MEGDGHRGAFDARKAEQELVGLMALVPAIVDAVRIPVVAAGGIADGRGVAAALTLGASAVVIGTGFLRCPETKLHPTWAAALAKTTPERTVLSPAFTGKPGRSVATDYVRAALGANAPAPTPYPVQRGLTTPMRLEAQKTGDVQRIQVLAGQSRRSCLRPLLIGVSLLRQSQTCCSSFSSARSGRKYIIAGSAIMTRASGV